MTSSHSSPALTYDYSPEWPLPLPAARDPRATEELAQLAGTLLQVARWHAGLTQTEAAARAGTSQQTLMRYETGRTQPTLPTLSRLLAACGMGLDAALVPQAPLDDPIIERLLGQPPLERLPHKPRNAVRTLIPLLMSCRFPVVLADRLAARLYGAPVTVYECDFLVPPGTVRVDEVEALVTAAGSRLTMPLPIDDGKREWDGSELLGKHLSRVEETDVRFAAVDDFDEMSRRARDVELVGFSVRLLTPPDVMRPWHPRERDRLLLTRAVMQRSRREGRRLL